MLLMEPITFLMPTSLALTADLAVERLIKLILAMSRIIKAIWVKIYT
mgnify:CR=1 FL=1